jgi:hypothetical protein
MNRGNGGFIGILKEPTTTSGSGVYGLYEQQENALANIWPNKFIPNAPTIGTATQTSSTSATVTFTAPAYNGNDTITQYIATSSPGGVIGTLNQAGSGTITVNGLSQGTPYTFTVVAVNSIGQSIPSGPSNQITTPISINVEYLVVAGGGGGGAGQGGGGGAGGYRTSTLSATPGTPYTVTVGGGGQGGTIFQQNRLAAPGSPSVFASITGNGGGGGGNDDGTGPSGATGQPGGSGGGGGAGGGPFPGGPGNQGNPGGNGGNNLSGGGGGGAGGGGSPAPNGVTGGAGGIGAPNSITGSAVYYAGGGGGCGNSTGGAGTPTTGGGGSSNGGDPSNGNPGTVNTGGGGGASRGSVGVAGTGGPGVVIIAYPTAHNALSSINPGLSYDQPSRPGFRVYRFTGGTGPIQW